MLIKNPRGWELPESAATPEALFRDRRSVLAGLGLGAIGAAAAAFAPPAHAATGPADPSAKLYPVKRNAKYVTDRPLTAEKNAASWNNFYEYQQAATDITDDAAKLKIRPWEVKITGLVDKPLTFAIDDLLAKMPLEERVYRHRCVETWSMIVPWTGFPLKALVDLAKPTSAAKYVKLVTFLNKDMAPGQRQFWWPWPYTEGLTIEEATHELTFLATGVYGHPAPPQHGAPLRLAVPWKYGFKAVKSIVEISFVAERPHTFWETYQPKEYGFWANVNPGVAHPRWSQATERPLDTSGRVPTLMYNGYGEFVASLYTGNTDPRLFM